MMNVLKRALKVIPKQQVTYKKFKKVVINILGQQVNTYESPITVEGSIQPTDQDTLYKLGIANTGDIYTVFLRGNAVSIAQIQSNDLIIGAGGEVYNIVRADIWENYPDQDWNRVLVKRAKKYGS
jgi:hypothetical protein